MKCAVFPCCQSVRPCASLLMAHVRSDCPLKHSDAHAPPMCTCVAGPSCPLPPLVCLCRRFYSGLQRVGLHPILVLNSACSPGHEETQTSRRIASHAEKRRVMTTVGECSLSVPCTSFPQCCSCCLRTRFLRCCGAGCACPSCRLRHPCWLHTAAAAACAACGDTLEAPKLLCQFGGSVRCCLKLLCI